MQRSATVTEVIHRLQQETASVPGITLYMQPSQDLSLDTTVSRTQYQFILESASADTLATWTPKLVAALRDRPGAGRCGQQPGEQWPGRLHHHRP